MQSNPQEVPPPTGAHGGKELSEREHEILRLVATGAGNKRIAQQLVISSNTVKVHLRNIFGKIGVASRTEAALYALREGLVQLPGGMPAIVEDNGSEPAEPPPATVPVIELSNAPARRRPRWAVAGTWVLGAILLAALLLVAILMQRPTTPRLGTPTHEASSGATRWRALPDLPTARSGLGVATYENQIYAIGGEAKSGVVGVVERFDNKTNTWTTLSAKPVPVADMTAAVIGGIIYVPGGRLASGGPTSVLEAYDPRQDKWVTRAPLPVPVSGYALVAFEGRLLIFGGWDGQRSLATVYSYDTATDAWRSATPMPTARAYAGAAVASGKIYVLGGSDGANILAENEEYIPENETEGDSPWHERSPLPEGRTHIGVASQADIIHLVGGQSAGPLSARLKYFPQCDEWQKFENPLAQPWWDLGLAVIETDLQDLGGRQRDAPTSHHLAYQAIYTVDIPFH